MLLRRQKIVDFNEITTLKLARLLRDDLRLYRQTPIQLLTLLSDSQQKHSRHLWYHCCFVLGCSSKVSDRFLQNRFNLRWKYSIFFTEKNLSSAFRISEYNFRNVPFLEVLKPALFRGTSLRKDPIVLPYTNFYLRAPLTLYTLLWYHVEQLRMRFFNDFIRFHEYINASVHLPRRFRLQRVLSVYPYHSSSRKKLFRFFFHRQLEAQRYRAVQFRGRPSSEFLAWNSVKYEDLRLVPLVFRRQRWQLFYGLAKWPRSLMSKEPLLRWLNYQQINLWANHLLATEPYIFRRLQRWDWYHYLISFPLFQVNRLRRRCVRIWSRHFVRDFMTQIIISPEFKDFWIVRELDRSARPMETNYLFSFLWIVLDLRINRYFQLHIWHRWIGCFVNGPSFFMSKYLHTKRRGLIRRLRQYTQRVLFLGQFGEVAKQFTVSLFALDFFFWRITGGSFTLYRQFLANGTFPLEVYHRKRALDHYSGLRLQISRRTAEKFNMQHGLYFHTGYVADGGINPWSRRKPYKRLRDGDYHPLEPRWSMISQSYSLIFRKFFFSYLRRSLNLSLACYFICCQKHWRSPIRNRLWAEVFLGPAAKERYFAFYRVGFLRRFRRFPKKVYIISRLDPTYRERWFAFSDRMRRAGIKKTDLPYYPADDQLDFIADLRKRERKAPWRRSPQRYWTFDE